MLSRRGRDIDEVLTVGWIFGLDKQRIGISWGGFGHSFHILLIPHLFLIWFCLSSASTAAWLPCFSLLCFQSSWLPVLLPHIFPLPLLFLLSTLSPILFSLPLSLTVLHLPILYHSPLLEAPLPPSISTFPPGWLYISSPAFPSSYSIPLSHYVSHMCLCVIRHTRPGLKQP